MIKTLHKKISFLRIDQLCENESRAITFLSDLGELFAEITHIPGLNLSITYLFSGRIRKKVAIVVSTEIPADCEEGSGFFDYLERHLEPYCSFEPSYISGRQWEKENAGMDHQYILAPSHFKYELFSPVIQTVVNPLLKMVEQVQMLNLKIALKVTLRSLDSAGKQEILSKLPLAGARMKLQNSGTGSIPSQLDWFSGREENDSVANEIHKIMGYELQLSSAAKLSSHAAFVIKRGLLGDYGEKFIVKDMKSQDEEERLFLAACNAMNIFQIPLAYHNNHSGLSIRDQPLLFNEPSDKSIGIKLGITNRAQAHDVIIPEESLNKHLFISGKTGTGKSSLLHNMITGICALGEQSVVLLDPHGDLAKDVVRHLPAKDLDRVVYIDFASDHAPGLNILDTNEQGLDFAIGELEHYFIRLYGPEIFGPRIQDAFRNFLTLLGLSDTPGTICDLLWALNLRDGQVHEQFKKTSQKNNRLNLLLFLEQVLARKGRDGSLEELTTYFRAKLSPFTDSMLRHNLGQQRTTLPFDSLIRERKIVLLNLNKGQLSGRHSSLLGTIITAMLFQTVMNVGTMHEEAERNPVAIFIDECQNYISPSIADILSEARKFNVSLVLACQHLDQLDNGATGFLTSSNLQEAILGNVGSLISFRSSHQGSKIMAEEMGVPVFPSHISSLPRFTAIARLADHNSFDLPISFITTLSKPKRKSIEKVKQASEKKYCRPRKEVDEELNARIKENLGWTEVPEDVVEDFFQ